MNKTNFMEVTFKALSVNEGFARVAVAGFCLPLNPSVEELGDIKTAVSEAVTNSVVHAYPKGQGMVTVRCEIVGDEVKITVKDSGIGIEDIPKAREPFYTTKPDEERSGMGFAVMESFMDDVEVESVLGLGTKITMRRKIKSNSQKEDFAVATIRGEE